MTTADRPQPTRDDDTKPSIWPGAYVAPEVRVGEGVTIGPNAVILAPDQSGSPPTVIEDGASLGGNATVMPGVTVGFRARVRPGAVVTRSIPPLAIAEGNPASIVGYVDADRLSTPAASGAKEDFASRQSRVRGVSIIRLRTAADIRGALVVAENGKDLPFDPKRWFLVHDVPSAETRGQHAHRTCHQLLLAVSGALRVVADDGENREEFRLDRPDLGLYLPAMTWGIQYGYSPQTVLLVVASELYDADDYVRDYGEFVRLAGRPHPAG